MLYCYHGELLEMALDLGSRLLAAFKSRSGIPYGTVNLRHGVPEKETPIASTAAAGTLMIEFEVLSSLTGNRTFGDLAANAAFGTVHVDVDVMIYVFYDGSMRILFCEQCVVDVK